MVDQVAELKLELEPDHNPNALHAAFPTDTHFRTHLLEGLLLPQHPYLLETKHSKTTCGGGGPHSTLQAPCAVSFPCGHLGTGIQC